MSSFTVTLQPAEPKHCLSLTFGVSLISDTSSVGPGVAAVVLPSSRVKSGWVALACCSRSHELGGVGAAAEVLGFSSWRVAPRAKPAMPVPTATTPPMARPIRIPERRPGIGGWGTACSGWGCCGAAGVLWGVVTAGAPGWAECGLIDAGRAQPEPDRRGEACGPGGGLGGGGGPPNKL